MEGIDEATLEVVVSEAAPAEVEVRGEGEVEVEVGEGAEAEVALGKREAALRGSEGLAREKIIRSSSSSSSSASGTSDSSSGIIAYSLPERDDQLYQEFQKENALGGGGGR